MEVEDKVSVSYLLILQSDWLMEFRAWSDEGYDKGLSSVVSQEQFSSSG